MDKEEYFDRLEMRVCRELAAMRDRKLRGYWCDGFIPDSVEITGAGCRINGRVWICWGRDQECWSFAISAGLAGSRELINWDEMLPKEEVTGWLTLDFANKLMKVDPSAAYKDCESDSE